MLATALLMMCGTFLLIALFIVSPVGAPYSDWLSQFASIRRAAYAIVFVNIAFIFYLFHFFSRLGEKNSIWLINIFVGWSIIAGFGLSAMVGFSFVFPLSASAGNLTVNAASEQQVFGLAVGLFFTVYSTNKYNPTKRPRGR